MSVNKMSNEEVMEKLEKEAGQMEKLENAVLNEALAFSFYIKEFHAAIKNNSDNKRDIVKRLFDNANELMRLAKKELRIYNLFLRTELPEEKKEYIETGVEALVHSIQMYLPYKRVMKRLLEDAEALNAVKVEGSIIRLEDGFEINVEKTSAVLQSSATA